MTRADIIEAAALRAQAVVSRYYAPQNRGKHYARQVRHFQALDAAYARHVLLSGYRQGGR